MDNPGERVSVCENEDKIDMLGIDKTANLACLFTDWMNLRKRRPKKVNELDRYSNQHEYVRTSETAD